jgi:hypothetical protein
MTCIRDLGANIANEIVHGEPGCQVLQRGELHDRSHRQGFRDTLLVAAGRGHRHNTAAPQSQLGQRAQGGSGATFTPLRSAFHLAHRYRSGARHDSTARVTIRAAVVVLGS